MHTYKHNGQFVVAYLHVLEIAAITLLIGNHPGKCVCLFIR